MLIVLRCFVMFMLYSFLGWFCEVVYCSIPAGKFINRGFLAGPICPVYGFGALIVVYLLTPVADYPAAVFVCGAVLTSALEYFTSFLLEKIFHTKLWDYSHKRWNIHGRVCLLNSVLFGILSLAVMNLLHPFTVRLVSSLNDLWLIILGSVLLALLLTDTVTSVRAMLLMSAKLEKLHETMEEMREKLSSLPWEQGLLLRERLDEWLSQRQALGEELGRRLEYYRDRMREAAFSMGWGQRRILKAFPHMKSIRHPEAMRNLRDALLERKEHKKK